MVDMRPTVEDEINAAWAETIRARRALARAEAERDGYRDALVQIMVRCGQGNEPQAAMSRAHHVARRALNQEQNREGTA